MAAAYEEARTVSKIVEGAVTKAEYLDGIGFMNGKGNPMTEFPDAAEKRLEYIMYLKTCSSPIQTFLLHALSFECTSKLCITFLNQFLVYFHILKMHNTI